MKSFGNGTQNIQKEPKSDSNIWNKGMGWKKTLKIVADTTSHVCLQIKFFKFLTKEIIFKLKIIIGVLVRSSSTCFKSFAVKNHREYSDQQVLND